MKPKRQTSEQWAMREHVLAYITEFCSCNGYSPTYREIGEAVGVKSASTVSRYVHWLMDEGLLTHGDAKPRTLTTATSADAAPTETIQQRVCLELADSGRVYLDFSMTKPRTALVELVFDGILDAQDIRGRVGRIVRCGADCD